MSTRALVRFFNKDFVEYARVYKHWDGYPDGFGLDIAKFIKDIKIPKGVSHKENTAAGVGCLIAQFIANFKKEVGDIYVESLMYEINDCSFYYHISVVNEDIIVGIFDYKKNNIFTGSPAEMLEFCMHYSDSGE